LQKLGDLHLKQGKAREAAAAFVKAHEISASKELAIKALQAYATAGDADSLRAAQDLVAKMAKRAEASKKAGPSGGVGAPPASTRLPRRLMITVTKDSADQVAQGKLSFQEFVKQAIVERQ
jgi:hypothetical protein